MIPEPLSFKRQVVDLERRIRDLERPPKAVQVTSGLSWSMETGWSMSNYVVTATTRHVDLLLYLTYTGTAVTFGTDGGTPNKPVLTVPSPYQPSVNGSGAFPVVGDSWNSGDALLLFTLAGNGSLTLVSGYPNATLINNADVRISTGYAT